MGYARYFTGRPKSMYTIPRRRRKFSSFRRRKKNKFVSFWRKKDGTIFKKTFRSKATAKLHAYRWTAKNGVIISGIGKKYKKSGLISL